VVSGVQDLYVSCDSYEVQASFHDAPSPQPSETPQDKAKPRISVGSEHKLRCPCAK
jgi:hypothetical protein